MRTRAVAAGAAVLALVGLTLGACSDDDDGDEVSSRIEASASEYEFEPDSWSVTAGREFTIEFENEGSIDHEWAVIKLGEDIDSEEEFTEEKVLFEVEALPAGESTTESFSVDGVGSYQVICAIEGHFDQGMEGTLRVE